MPVTIPPGIPFSLTVSTLGVQDGVADQYGFMANATLTDGRVLSRATPASGPGGFANGNFSRNAVTRVGPVMNNMTGWFMLGLDATQTVKNLAPGGSDATIVGTPVIRQSYATLGGSSYLQTNISETNAYTVLAVARLRDGVTSPHGGTILACDTLDAASSGGATKLGALLAILQDSATVLTGSVTNRGQYGVPSSQTIAQGVPTLAITDTSQWRLVAATVSATTLLIEDLTAGTSASLPGSVNGFRMPNTSTPFRIGVDNGPNFNCAIDISEVVIYGRALATAEKASMHSFMQGFQSARGIVI